MVDEVLAKSFLDAGEDYERYRPGFPEAAAEAIIPVPVRAALDLGAGTGKFTERLIGRASRVIAVEPSRPMLDVLRAKLPSVEALIGTAEEVPVEDASVDVVTVAQAFHWFDRERACAQIRLVLVPGGVLGLLWNRFDPACAWDRACQRILHPALGDRPGATTASVTEELPGFVLEARREIAWRERITRTGYLRRWQTVSSFLVADDRERRRMTAGIEAAGITEVFVYRSAKRRDGTGSAQRAEPAGSGPVEASAS
ncbi:class I SAM-dependent methyltransferase [Microbacterium neungamense]|uniref:class I SAM-dependent methyltransferase n=1 Tax=Microbacterium neungamense TaxID=2810535 RepID=UPI00217CF95D|nr:class I SAM-dependent methyltransferase [Microbacterium neungamense]UWF78469.1 class I SAM-dependent methyltransferase [Microbacterium neungamense]